MDVVQLVDRKVDLTRRKVRRGGSTTPLTDQEAALLAYLVARPGQVVPRDELLERVWGYADGVVTRAVDAAVRRLRNKIEADAADPVHLVTVHGVGYRYEPVALPAEEGLVVVTDWGDGLRDVDGPLHDEVVAIANGLVEAAASRHGGKIQVSTPEATVASFDLPLSAVRFALAVQRELVAAAWPDAFERRLRVRPRRSGPPGVWRGLLARAGVGSDRQTALRECATAFGGQIRIAEDLADAIGAATDLGAVVTSRAAEPSLEIVPVELVGRSFPSRAGSRLPSFADTFVGRRDQLTVLGDAVTQHRLVTLTGPAGVGKTRLAAEFAHRWANEGRAWFCDLSPAASLGEVLHIVAETLGAPVRGVHEEGAVQAIGMALAGRGAELLLLDDFERFATHAAATVAVWQELAPDMTILVTSRHRLTVPGEHVIEVPPLPTTDGVALFEQRAPAGAALHVNDRDTIAAIVGQVDGLPLAIELSAARTHVLAPIELLEHLSTSAEARFAVLRNLGDADPTLWGALETSWQLLDDAGREALSHCSVFRSPFDLAAATAILPGTEGDVTATADRLAGLRDRSLLQAHRDETGRVRFTLLASVRDHAWAYLEEAERAEVRARHRHHFASFGTDAALERTYGPDALAWLTARTLELPDLVAALQSARNDKDAPSAVALARTLAPIAVRCGALFTAAEAIGAAEDVAASTEIGPLKTAQSEVLDAMGDPRAIATATEALAAAESSGRDDHLARAHLQLGRAMAHRADEAGAVGHFEAALRHAQRVDLVRVEAQALGALANVHSKHGETELAKEQYRLADARFSELGDARGRALVAVNLAAAAADRGRLAEARRGYLRAIDHFRTNGEGWLVAHVLCNLGNVLTALGELSEAEPALREAHAIFSEAGHLRGRGRASLLLAENLLYGGDDVPGSPSAPSARGAERGDEAARPNEPEPGPANREDAALPVLDEAIDDLRRAGDRRNLGLAFLTRGRAVADRDPASARDAIEAGVEALRQTGDPRNITFGLVELALRDVADHDTEAARARLDEAEKLARQADDPLTTGLMDCGRGTLALADGDPDEAKARRESAQRARTALGLSTHSSLGRAIAALTARIGDAP